MTAHLAALPQGTAHDCLRPAGTRPVHARKALGAGRSCVVTGYLGYQLRG